MHVVEGIINMENERKELNHKINMLYRQLGKNVYDDLKQDRLKVKEYKKQTKAIKSLVKAICMLDIEMDSVEEEVSECLADKR